MEVPLTAEIHRDGEWFVAFCPEVPEANGQGRTQEESIASLREAILLLMEDRREDARKRGGQGSQPARTAMTEHQFAPGFRISGSDLLILLLGCAGSVFGAIHFRWIGLVIGIVTAHFFLFCNVFRISRRPELLWAGIFILLAACTILTGLPGWIATIAVSLLVAAALIMREMKLPSYHGVGWTRINPELREWWDANLKSDTDGNR